VDNFNATKIRLKRIYRMLDAGVKRGCIARLGSLG